MKKIFLFVLMAVCAAAGFSQTPTAAEIVRRVDDNEVYTTLKYEGEMIIEYQSRRYVKNMTSFMRGNSDSFIEFLNSEDRGTKYLKKSGRLYVYSPDNEEVMLISGHMLKESMMGSDMSYEDTIENETLSARYTPVMAGSETYNGREAWVLELTAKRKTESYPGRKLWVDKENYDILHYELFALSGAKLKEYTLIRAETFGSRRFPVESEMRDLLRRGSSTRFIMRSIELDIPIPDSVFSTRNLER